MTQWNNTTEITRMATTMGPNDATHRLGLGVFYFLFYFLFTNIYIYIIGDIQVVRQHDMTTRHGDTTRQYVSTTHPCFKRKSVGLFFLLQRGHTTTDPHPRYKRELVGPFLFYYSGTWAGQLGPDNVSN
jgi:hypothetical protein